MRERDPYVIDGKHTVEGCNQVDHLRKEWY